MKIELAVPWFGGWLAVMLAVSVWAAASSQAAVADFYQGKSIQIVVGHGAGGGFDTYSRAIARHLSKHIPGKPSVIVVNMPGAGGLVAASHVYTRAAKDGTVIGNVIGGMVRSQLLEMSGVQFDASKFQYLGAPNSESSVLMMTKASGITRFEQLLEPGGKPATLGDGGIATTNHVASWLTREVLHANVKVLTGYGTTAKVELAMDAGEIDGQYNDWASNKARTLAKFETGAWLLVGQLTDKPLQGLPQQNVPLILKYAKNDEQRELLRFGIIVPNQFTRPYFLPPGVSADKVSALRLAFATTMADREFLTDASKAKLDISPVDAGEIQKLIVDYLNMRADLKDKLMKVLPHS